MVGAPRKYSRGGGLAIILDVQSPAREMRIEKPLGFVATVVEVVLAGNVAEMGEIGVSTLSSLLISMLPGGEDRACGMVAKA